MNSALHARSSRRPSRRSTALALAVTLLAGPAALAQRIEEFPLRPLDARAPAPPPEEISYRPSGHDDRGFNRVVRKVSVPTLTIYFPAAPAPRRAAFLVIPGGGYDGIVIDREGYAIARYLQAQGIAAAVLKYRLPAADTFAAGLPAPQQDALAAVKFLRDRAGGWQINPARIGVMGASAGGHLAASVAVLGEAAAGTRPDFAVLLYPVISFEPPWAHEGSRTKLLGTAAPAERVREFSLHHRVRPGLPPFFVTHARDDKTVPVENAELLAAALKQARVPVELLTPATGGHGFSLGRGDESAAWKDRMLHWLDALP